MKSEKGEMIIEASIIFPLILLIYGMIMFMVLVMYQKIMATTIASDTASSVAVNYGMSEKDPFFSYVEKSQLNNRSMLYREIIGTNKKMNQPLERQAEWFAYYSLNKSRLLKAEEVKVQADLSVKSGKIMQKELVVNIKETYHIPLVSMLGIEDKVVLDISSSAECVDIISYKNMTDFVWDEAKKMLEIPDLKLVKKMIDFVK